MLRCSIADCYLTDMAAYNVVLDEERNGRWAVTIKWVQPKV